MTDTVAAIRRRKAEAPTAPTPFDPDVYEALSNLQASEQGQAAINASFKQMHSDALSRIAFLEDVRQQDEAWLRALQQQPTTTGTTWPDLISRWTSRTWLLPFLSGVTTVATTVGATLGALDPRIAAGSAAVTALFGSLFIAFEKIGDNAVRVAAAQKAPTVHAE